MGKFGIGVTLVELLADRVGQGVFVEDVDDGYGEIGELVDLDVATDAVQGEPAGQFGLRKTFQLRKRPANQNST